MFSFSECRRNWTKGLALPGVRDNDVTHAGAHSLTPLHAHRNGAELLSGGGHPKPSSLAIIASFSTETDTVSLLFFG